MGLATCGHCRSVAAGNPVRCGARARHPSDWNRGAFALTPFWLFNHGAPWLGVAYLTFSWVPLLTTSMSVYFGNHGNDFAMRHRTFDDVAQFVAVQAAWSHAGLVMWRIIGGVIGVIGSLVAIGLAMQYFGK